MTGAEIDAALAHRVTHVPEPRAEQKAAEREAFARSEREREAVLGDLTPGEIVSRGLALAETARAECIARYGGDAIAVGIADGRREDHLAAGLDAMIATLYTAQRRCAPPAIATNIGADGRRLPEAQSISLGRYLARHAIGHAAGGPLDRVAMARQLANLTRAPGEPPPARGVRW